MAIEAASSVYGLNQNLPLDGDEQAEGDDHIRVIKTVLKATFPGLGGALGRVISKSIGFTPGVTENTCIFHCTAALTVTLPAVAGVPDGTYYLVNAFGGDLVIYPNGTELINGQATVTVSSGSWVLVGKLGGAWIALVTALPNTAVHAALAKATPADGDELLLVDSADTWKLKKFTWANIKTVLGSLYMALVAPGTSGNILTSNGSAWTSAAPSGVPTGAVEFFAMSSAPTGWIKANGAAINRTTYSSLFTAIGTTFGVGDGSTTFNVPDLRGEFIRGWDDARGVDSGRAIGSWQNSDNKSHTHNFRGGNTVNGGTIYNAQYGGGGSGYTIEATGSIVSAGGVEARPRNIALLACIKY